MDADAADAPARKRPRFLGDGGSSDNEGDESGAAASKAQFDRLFDLSDEDLPPPLQFADHRANTAAAIAAAAAKRKSAADTLDLFGDGTGAGADGEEGADGVKAKKKRPPRPKIDEARLTGPKGFDALRADLVRFKPKGKGSEVRWCCLSRPMRVAARAAARYCVVFHC